MPRTQQISPGQANCKPVVATTIRGSSLLQLQDLLKDKPRMQAWSPTAVTTLECLKFSNLHLQLQLLSRALKLRVATIGSVRSMSQQTSRSLLDVTLRVFSRHKELLILIASPFQQMWHLVEELLNRTACSLRELCDRKFIIILHSRQSKNRLSQLEAIPWVCCIWSNRGKVCHHRLKTRALPETSTRSSPSSINYNHFT